LRTLKTIALGQSHSSDMLAALLLDFKNLLQSLYRQSCELSMNHAILDLVRQVLPFESSMPIAGWPAGLLRRRSPAKYAVRSGRSATNWVWATWSERCGWQSYHRA